MLGGSPCEVGVRLLETSLAKGAHHRWPSKGLCQEDHFGMDLIDASNQIGPELDWLGMGIIDSKNFDAF